METALPKDQLLSELARQATKFAEMLAKQELKCEVLGEVLGQNSGWTELRSVFKQHLRIWQQFTTANLAIAPDGSLAGWSVESRKARCGIQAFSDADVETRARMLKTIHRRLRLTGIRRVPLDEQRGLAVATFVGANRTEVFEVSVNPTDGEVIGFMPVPAGKLSPLAIQDPEAGKAQELAWQQVDADLRVRLGAEASAEARSVLKLVPQSAMQDEAGRSFWVFRLWRFFSTCDVSIDEATREVVGWYLEALANEAPDRVIKEAGAVQAARPELKAAQGAQGPRVTFDRKGEAEYASVYWWHAEENISIEGDQTAVLVNATTGKPYSVWQKWRKISPELLKQPAIAPEQALRAADRAIEWKPADPPGEVFGKFVIQVAADPNQPSPVHDALVWRIGYSQNEGMSRADVAVDCKTGECVRITGW